MYSNVKCIGSKALSEYMGSRVRQKTECFSIISNTVIFVLLKSCYFSHGCIIEKELQLWFQ